MSIENRPNSASALHTEPEMENSLSQDPTSDQIATIEDALQQASQEILRAAQNTNPATTSKDRTEEEEDFVYVEKPKVKDENTSSQDSNIPHDAKQDSDIQSTPSLNDPEHAPHDTETQPPVLRDDLENTGHATETQSPALDDNPERIPHDAKTQSTLRDDPEHTAHDQKMKNPTFSDNPKERMCPSKDSCNPDSNTDFLGFTSKKTFFGGVLVGATIIAVGAIIYKYFKSPSN